MTIAPAGAATPSTVNTVAATTSGGTISVTGTAGLGGQDPVVLTEDGVGDAPGGAASTALGLDMDKLLISRSTATSSSLLFTIKLGGMTGGGIPETILYNWDINVNGGAGAGGTSVSIKTMRSRASATQNTDPYAGVFGCTPTATGFSCTEQTRLTEVAYDASTSEIRMTVPLAAIGAQSGSVISAWARSTNPFWIGPSASGAQTLTNVFDTGTHDDYLVPGATVKLGIAPAGQSISYTTNGTIAAGTGAFSGTLATPSTPGAYDVGAKVCFGTNCGTGTTSITVT